MRAGRVPLAALLLVLVSQVLQVSSTNDIYREGEEYASNEFLEMKKHEEPTVLDKRFKRQWDLLGWGLTTEKEAETTTDTVPDDNGSYGKEDADVDVRSGVPDKSDSEPREKTLRVTFLVFEPYLTEYSNRDSPQFLNISRSLANAVDLLFESLPGTQRSSLVRIQSLVNDDFLCRVTLDIVTTRNDDTDTIKDILRNHINNIGRLGVVAVRDGDFSAQLIDPGSGDGEINPDTNMLYNPSKPDNSRKLVAIEGTNETIIYCSQSSGDNVRWARADRQPFQGNVYQNRSRLIINNVSKADSGEYMCNIYNQNNEIQEAVYTSLVVITAPKITLLPLTQTVRPGESPTVDCIVDGDDIIDITWQPLNTNPSDRVDTSSSRLVFHEIEVEDAGRYECIARSRYADVRSIAEVIVSEDTDHTASVSHDNEQRAHVGAAVHLSCKVSQNNVRIVWSKDGRALPRSVRQKNDGSLFIRLAKKSDAGKYVCSIRDLNGRTVTSNYINLHIQGCDHICDDGTCLEASRICNGKPDCSNRSDELDCYHCDGPYDFRCGSEECIMYSQRCNGIPECLDHSDERNCNETMIPIPDQPCTSEQFKCTTDKVCIDQNFLCDGTQDCVDGSDEDNCPADSSVTEPPRTPPPEQTALVQITSPTINVQEVGSGVNFTCQAVSRNSRARLAVRWTKSDGNLPLDRTQIDENIGLLLISNLQVADSGKYICETSDGINTAQAYATLKVPDERSLSKEEPRAEYHLMHQEFQQLRTEVAQLKVSLNTSNERVVSLEARVNALQLKLNQKAPSIKDPLAENSIAEVKFQLNKQDQKLLKDIKVTGIPEDKIITIKLVVTAEENDVLHAERIGSTRNPVETSDGSISLSISADLAGQRSRSISVG